MKILKNTKPNTALCDECYKNKQSVIQLGERVEYGSNTARICKECLEKAYVMFIKNNNYS